MTRKTRCLVFGVGVLIACVFSLIFSRPAQAADESLTLETYYPAPYGIYSDLQLYPKDNPSACNANSRGTMYYDDSDNQVMVCKDVGSSSYMWTSMGFRRMIVMWSGDISAIPNGWQLCDGTNGTPDLRDKFILGSGGSFSVGDSGGSETHIHSINPPSTETGNGIMKSQTGVWQTNSGYWVQTHDVNIPRFDSESAENLPPYYALAYIMRL